MSRAYAHHLLGFHEEAAGIAREWPTNINELDLPVIRVLYYLSTQENELARKQLQGQIDSRDFADNMPTRWIVFNAFDDPALNEPAMAAIRKRFRREAGWE